MTKLITISLFLLLIVSCGKKRAAFRDRECNHSHICCRVKCPCCNISSKYIKRHTKTKPQPIIK
jgi:hypothetical protein